MEPQSTHKIFQSKSDSDSLELQVQQLKDNMAAQGIALSEEDLQGLRAYLRTKPKWEEVYRRLAES